MSLLTTPSRLLRLALPLLLFGAAVAPAGSASANMSPAPQSVGDVLAAPKGLRAERLPENPNDFVVSWRAVGGNVHHYNVSVFARGHDVVRTVAADATSLKVAGIDLSTVYRITVSSRDAAGRGGTSGPIWLWPALPSAPSALSVLRDGKGGTMTASWKLPVRQGFTPVMSYRYTLTKISTGEVVAEGKGDGTKVEVGDLDSLRQYVLKVRAVNAQGEGATATALLGNDRPGAPTRTAATRVEGKPDVVNVSWATPAYAGYAPIEYFEVLFGTGSLRETQKVPADTQTATVSLDPTRKGVVAVRACSAAGCGQLGVVVSVAADPASTGVPTTPETATTNPMVDIQELNGSIRVEVNGVIGSTTRFPQLVIRVLPSADNGGFTDTQWGQNGAQLMTFSTVPTGAYIITVHGVSSSGAETELARKVIVIGDAGALTAADWKVVFGRATIKDGVVDMPFAGENRVMSTRTRSTSDMVLTTTATLRYGWGYGVWFRAKTTADGKIDGYTFQYDPMFGNKFIIRIWNNGRECSTPLTATPFPRGFQENVPHLLTVVVKGDSVWATIDGAEVFRVDSLTAAIASSRCGYSAPNGTQIGFRTWSTSSAVFENTTLS